MGLLLSAMETCKLLNFKGKKNRTSSLYALWCGILLLLIGVKNIGMIGVFYNRLVSEARLIGVCLFIFPIVLLSGTVNGIS